MNKIFASGVLIVIVLSFIACTGSNGSRADVLKEFSIDDSTQVMMTSTSFDEKNSADGNGALRINVNGDAIIPLFETGEIDIEDATLLYKAKLKSENLDGVAFLQMWCVFDGKGEYFSKGLNTSITGTKDWQESQTPFFLKKGENPSNVKLQLVVSGTGTVWIDDIKIEKAKLPAM
ncbi:MAG: hypothetical protein JW737_07950 [Acidobacteria bacterium]|nr:hypothetical protein [Acidobacteriota bacterium]